MCCARVWVCQVADLLITALFVFSVILGYIEILDEIYQVYNCYSSSIDRFLQLNSFPLRFLYMFLVFTCQLLYFLCIWINMILILILLHPVPPKTIHKEKQDCIWYKNKWLKNMQLSIIFECHSWRVKGKTCHLQ